mgnify:CR=1 FL=1
MKKQIKSKNAPQPIGPYSQAIKHGNMVFISGQIAIDPKTNKIITNNIIEETKMVFQNIDNILKECDCDFNNIVKCSIFLSDMKFFESVNKVYSSYFTAPYPARETTAVKLPKNVNVEISAIAMCK